MTYVTHLVARSQHCDVASYFWQNAGAAPPEWGEEEEQEWEQRWPQSTLLYDKAELMERPEVEWDVATVPMMFQVDGNQPLAEVQDKVCAPLTSHLRPILRS